MPGPFAATTCCAQLAIVDNTMSFASANVCSCCARAACGESTVADARTVVRTKVGTLMGVGFPGREVDGAGGAARPTARGPSGVRGLGGRAAGGTPRPLALDPTLEPGQPAIDVPDGSRQPDLNRSETRVYRAHSRRQPGVESINTAGESRRLSPQEAADRQHHADRRPVGSVHGRRVSLHPARRPPPGPLPAPGSTSSTGRPRGPRRPSGHSPRRPQPPGRPRLPTVALDGSTCPRGFGPRLTPPSARSDFVTPRGGPYDPTRFPEWGSMAT